MRASLFVLVLLFAVPPSGHAQQASPYVPLSHWTMPYIEHLISAGVLVDPTPLTRPFKLSVLVRALLAADTTAASAAVRATVRRLLREWQPVDHRPHYRAEVSVGGAAATYSTRDPLELDRGVPPRRIDRRAFGNVGADIELLLGSFVGVSHPVVDTRLNSDPDRYAVTNTATRFDEAYVSWQSRWGEAFFGILDRNWGPSGIQGVMLSDNPYGMDHVAIALGTPGIQIQAMATQLNTLDSAGRAANRYMEQHRLWIHPPSRWTLALWEASVLSGVGRQLEPWYLNLATVSYLRATDVANVNSFVGIDFERRADVTLFGQFMLDDIQVSRNSLPGELKPASYAFTVGAKGRAARASATWMLFYTQVANLAYRNEDDLQVPLYYGLPTGRNFDDYDQATAQLSVIVRPSFLLEPEVTLLRQGEGDPQLPHPLAPAYPTTAVLFQGVVERIVRLAVGGSWQRGDLSLTGNGGVHFISNLDHVTGVSKTEFVGAIGLTYRFHRQDLLP